MKTLNSLKLKKGQTVFLFASWNGVKNKTIDFNVQEYTIHSIGKKRCYLLFNDDINAKREINCENSINVELSLDAAISECKLFIPNFIKNEIEDREYRINKWNNNIDYVNMMKEEIQNLQTAQKRIIFNQFSTDDLINVINL